MERTPDRYDLKAARVHGEPKPSGTPVNVVAADLSFGTVLRLAVMFAIAQSFIAGVVFVVLLLFGAI